MEKLICTQIPEDQKYWFVRTDAGRNYKDFLDNNFIGIDYEMLSIEKFKELGDRKSIKEFLKASGYKSRNLGLAITNLERFIISMQVGDAVVIPSIKSNHFAFGYIISEPYTADKPELDKSECKYSKRRKIEWIDEVPAWQLDRHFLQLRFAQAAISSANDYSEYIDNIIGGYFYCKGDNASIVISAGEDGNISMQKLADFLNATLALAKKANPDLTEDDLSIKLSLQSRGSIKIAGALGVMFILAAGFICLNKEETSFEVAPYFKPTELEAGIKITGTVKGEPILKQISDYKDKELEREFKQLELENKKMKVEAMKRQLSQENKITISNPK